LPSITGSPPASVSCAEVIDTQSADTPINFLQLVSLRLHLFVERFQLGSQIDHYESDFVDPASE
jgi:hypothetical protein